MAAVKRKTMANWKEISAHIYKNEEITADEVYRMLEYEAVSKNREHITERLIKKYISLKAKDTRQVIKEQVKEWVRKEKARKRQKGPSQKKSEK